MSTDTNSDGFRPNSALTLGAAPCNECGAPAIAGYVHVGRHRAPSCTDHVAVVRRVLTMQAAL